MIVDVHHHYADGAFYTDYTDFPAQLVAAMDRYGWDKTCLNGLGRRSHNLGNREVAAAVKRFPDRIVGVGYLDVDHDAPDQVDALREQGMRGLKVISTLRRYDDDAYLPHYQRAEAAGMPILFHTGFLGGPPAGGPEDISSDRYRPMTLDRIARLFPKLTLIAAHMGTTIWFGEAIMVMNNPNVYGDTSGGPGGLPPEFFRLPPYTYLNWNKVVFGSDSLPNDGHIPFNSLKSLMEGLGLPQKTRAAVLGGTAARLFGL